MSLKTPSLLIPNQMLNKVRYFLQQNKGREWSGPAWYSVKYQRVPNKKQFPLEITLEYFHPLHLGDGSSTDWDGDQLQKIFMKLRKLYPKIGKTWEQGNIHSHHEMGAFFSATDEEQCREGANENFFYSLVASTKPKKEFYFGLSYPDDYGRPQIEQDLDIEYEETVIEEKDWKMQQKKIKKDAKKNQPKVTAYTYGKTRRQGNLFSQYNSLFNGVNQTEEKEDPSERYEDYCDAMSFGLSYGINEEPLDYLEFQEYDSIMLDWERGRIKTPLRDKKLKKLGVDSDGKPLS